jgi:hypothetical protein
MAVCNHWDKASQQHMAHRQQADSEHPTVLVHQHQIALVRIALVRQRLALVQRQNPQLENQQDLQKPIQTLCLTEDNNGT